MLDRGTSNARLNPRFKDFCRYYGYTPRLGRPYRARTKGKVESGVKYVKRSFLPGKDFSSLASANERVWQWITNVADERIHGTVHEKPTVRFRREALRPFVGKPAYLQQEPHLRKVATDCLVSFETNRYSVPWKYVNQTVDIHASQDGLIRIYHRGTLVAQHIKPNAKHNVVMGPKHYLNLSQNRKRKKNEHPSSNPPLVHPEVQVRSLAVYESLAAGGGCNG